jgi:hypothetical protein
VAAVVAGLVVRGWVLSTPLGRVDSDEAVTGLMARHFLRGEWTTFYWGSYYGGPIESIFAAPLTAVCNSGLVMKALTTLLYGLAAVLTWQVGKKTVGERAGAVAALLFWLYPAAFVLLSTKSKGWYGASMLIALGVMLVVLRLVEQLDRRLVAVLGLLLGLGLWTSALALYIAIPAAAWLVARRPAVLRHIWLAAGGALLGAAPWIYYNVRYDWVGLTGGAEPFPAAYFENLEGFFTSLLPRSLGLRMTFSGQWMGGWLAQIAYLALLVLFAVYAVRTFRRGGNATLLAVVALAYPFFFALAELSWYTDEPRYGLGLGPIIALLVAHGLVTVTQRTWIVVGALAAALLATVLSFNVLFDFSEEHPGTHTLASPDMRPLIDYLSRENVDAVYAEYWLAYALTSEAEEEITATAFVLPQVRYLPYEARVKARGSPEVFVLYRGSSDHTAFLERMERFRLAPRHDDLGPFSIYWVDRGPDVPDEVLRAPPP